MSARSAEGAPAPLAEQLTALLAGLLPDADRGLLAAMVLTLHRALQDGHACTTLIALAAAAPGAAPATSSLRAALLATGAVAAADGDAEPAPLPLVLDRGDRLYFRRHFAAERGVVRALQAKLAAKAPIAPASLAALRALAPAGPIDWQAVAVGSALRSCLSVIVGGPGTGKTTTVRKLLAVLRAGAPELRIALAAPTGKAAARLDEAVRADAGSALPALPRATTLHRLLGYLPVEDAFRQHALAPLPYDLVVVDEASMVDLELMDALLQALPATARLCLLGDRDQLGSVAPGQVLADLCQCAAPERGHGPELVQFAREHLGMALPAVSEPGPLADAVVQLRTNYRFAGQPGIGAFAQALAARAPAAALQALQAGHPDLVLRPVAELTSVLDECRGLLAAQAEASSPDEALAALRRFRVLCAVRHGPLGVLATNARIETLLRARGLRTDGAFYRGRPLLITANDHQSGLFNGDLGVAWPDDDGRMMAWFAVPDGAARPVLPLRLPAHETAWAMTVHKSQGSEFDAVLVLLPDRESPLLHAPLLYTAVTRARQRAVLVGEPTLLAAALGRQPTRASGLASMLAATAAGATIQP